MTCQQAEWRDIARAHIRGPFSENIPGRIVDALVLFPTLPLTLAKGRHWGWRAAAIVSFVLLVVLALPGLAIIGFPVMLHALAIEIWHDIA